MNPIRRLSFCALAAAVLVSACTSDSPEDRTDAALAASSEALPVIVASVVDPLRELDAAALGEAIGEAEVGSTIVRTAERAMSKGDITSMAFEPQEPELVEVEPLNDLVSVAWDVPYTIEWTSEAAAEPVDMDGDFRIEHRYSPEEETSTWVIALRERHLFPGFDDARTLRATYSESKRGAIKDRDGRTLAKGPADARRYPFGTVAGSTIGHIGALTKADVKEKGEGEPGDLYGASGLEAAFDDRLSGMPSSKLDVVDATGETIDTIGSIEGSPGENVKVTLDMEIQRAAEAAFGSTTGGAVLIQPETGDILAVVDSSTFGPQNYVGATDVEPFNRALSGGYPPGSSLKVMTAAAALDSGKVKPTTTVTGPAEYQGVRNFESGAFGSIPFSTAVKFSVNTAFAQVAQDMGGKLLTRYAEEFGFNAAPTMSLEARTSSFPMPADLGDLMWASVGQAQVLATPLQMASVVATIANDGERMEPRIDLDEDPQGTQVVSARVADQLTEMLISVVQGGTGVNAQIGGVQVAGKTGTAEVDVDGKRKNHAWFVAFAPAGSPKLAVAVVSEYGGVGGQVAAPLARAILQGSLPLAP